MLLFRAMIVLQFPQFMQYQTEEVLDSLFDARESARRLSALCQRRVPLQLDQKPRCAARLFQNGDAHHPFHASPASLPPKSVRVARQVPFRRERVTLHPAFSFLPGGAGNRSVQGEQHELIWIIFEADAVG